MNVVVVIDGREAVPVRAIPLLTNWETMSPDIVARALAWDEDAMYFEGLQAFQFDEGRRAVPATWWENMARRQLTALSHAIKAVQITHETGLQEWRRKSLEVLPAGVFVWKDEFEPMHCMRYGPGGTTLLKNLVQVTEEQHERLVALDFDPFIPDKEMQSLVMEGFGPTTHSTDGEEADFVLGFYGVTLKSKIEHWAAMAEVQPLEAARLLCGEDPFNIQAYADSLEVKMLTRIFEDRARSHPACRDLRDWALVAQQSRADHREGISKAVVYLAANTVTTTQATPTAASASNAPAWTVANPKRYSGYTAPLHRLLVDAHREAKPRPTARHVLEAWRSKVPAEIAKVLTDGCDYYDANGDTKTADLEAIRKAIDRMTTAR